MDGFSSLDHTEALACRHQRIRPYTPRHNGKVERYNRLLTDEILYFHPYPNDQTRRDAIGVWANHFNCHRPHTARSEQSPASQVRLSRRTRFHGRSQGSISCRPNPPS